MNAGSREFVYRPDRRRACGPARRHEYRPVRRRVYRRVCRYARRPALGMALRVGKLSSRRSKRVPAHPYTRARYAVGDADIEP